MTSSQAGQARRASEFVRFPQQQSSTTTASTHSEVGNYNKPAQDNSSVISPRTEMIWATLGATFHEKFTGRYPTPGSKIIGKRRMQAILHDLSNEQIDYGIFKCNSWVKDFAPNSPQFRELCLAMPKPATASLSPPTRLSDDVSIPRLVNEGAEICRQLKKIYPEINWTEIGEEFNKLKKSFSASLQKDKNSLEVLLAIRKTVTEEAQLV